VQWAAARGVHTVVDEVYACSIYRHGSSFESSLGFDSSGDVNKVMLHTLYGFAKDFGVAGWRVGVLHSRNPALIAAVRADCHHCEASTLTLGVIERVLADADAVRFPIVLL
jgi:aspartate/methionine/tyrosine aminotransferase